MNLVENKNGQITSCDDIVYATFGPSERSNRRVVEQNSRNGKSHRIDDRSEWLDLHNEYLMHLKTFAIKQWDLHIQFHSVREESTFQYNRLCYQ